MAQKRRIPQRLEAKDYYGLNRTVASTQVAFTLVLARSVTPQVHAGFGTWTPFSYSAEGAAVLHLPCLSVFPLYFQMARSRKPPIDRMTYCCSGGESRQRKNTAKSRRPRAVEARQHKIRLSQGAFPNAQPARRRAVVRVRCTDRCFLDDGTSTTQSTNQAESSFTQFVFVQYPRGTRQTSVGLHPAGCRDYPVFTVRQEQWCDGSVSLLAETSTRGLGRR